MTKAAAIVWLKTLVRAEENGYIREDLNLDEILRYVKAAPAPKKK